ncbi:MAG: ABC transporter permease subunit [Proteobacteria bacterium]|nr:ABC transporter permease subunit [Pseudomonadota bacterium]
MFEWLSYHRAYISAVLIIVLFGAFCWSIVYGVKVSRARDKEQVFGDPERTLGGWYWALCGVMTILLIWFYYSWGMARAYFPTAANELCQVAKLHEAVSPITARLPIGSRYYKSTDLVVRNSEQLAEVVAAFPGRSFTANEAGALRQSMDDIQRLIVIYSDPQYLGQETARGLQRVETEIRDLTTRLDRGEYIGEPSPEALAQMPWGIGDEEIPLLPQTRRGVMYDTAAGEAASIAEGFVALRNTPPAAEELIGRVRANIDSLKASNAPPSFNEVQLKARNDYIKAVERIFRRLDDGTIFPAGAMAGINLATADLLVQAERSKGGLRVVDALFFPGVGVVKSRTICIEQGSSRWLPKPTDVISRLWQLANPNVAEGGGYKGTTLLWVKWLPIASVVDFFVPDVVVDVLPGEYGLHNTQGEFSPTYKDKLLAFASGEVYLGAVPMLDGHIWDSVFRVLVALGLGVLLGVPLGIYMGVSRFFKSFFDPMIELYRPVPPLAWAPLILTIFGIEDDGKIFLLFMVAFAIMVISARTGASGTQLSKIRAAHSLGANNGQILRHVILPNALPEILTGVRIAIGVCWGTLVAAEILAGTTGIGFIENVARTVSDYELIWVTILIMGLLGLAFDLIMRHLIGILIPWRGKG